jgi:hypothetical protein
MNSQHFASTTMLNDKPPFARQRLVAAAWVVVLGICCSQTAAAQPSGSHSSQSVLLAPPPADEPAPIVASFRLLSMSQMNDEAETVAFSGILTLVWKDERQAFDPEEEGVGEKVFSGAYQFNEISPGWYPQVTLANSGGQYDTRAVSLRIKPDGTSTLSEAFDAVAKVDLNMRRFPFDRQRLEAVFKVIGFNADEVVLKAAPNCAIVDGALTKMPQWTLESIDGAVRTTSQPDAGAAAEASTFIVGVHLRRESLFMLRLVAMPLSLIVMLSWSVFWMDRSSLGDRMSVSFVGILTAVAYQITLAEIVPNVSYLTLLNGFVNLSLLMMSITAVINLLVAAADRHGYERGDRIDRCCRWLFPLAYFGLNGIATAVVLLYF